MGMNKISPKSVAAFVAALMLAWAAPGAAAPLSTVTARPGGVGATAGFDGVVEPVRQTVIAAQVSGAVVQLDVKVGDLVKGGQVLVRIDARAADQNAAASDAQVLAARAALEVATKQYERQQQLFQKNYISQAAMERAESEFKATRAQLAAQGAQAGAVRTESGFYTIRAPYGGVVASVPVTLGDMAMPGRPLLTLYDPAALRVAVAVPQTVVAQLVSGPAPRVEVPGLPARNRWVASAHMEVLPVVDAATHTVVLRLDLPGGQPGMSPGMFARVWLALADGAAGLPAANVLVPLTAIVRRSEMTAVYVVEADGRPVLRQVRLGRAEGDQVEILSGLMAGERVASDPQAAARTR
jgi:RND family efflux transporter MFP subunit